MVKKGLEEWRYHSDWQWLRCLLLFWHSFGDLVEVREIFFLRSGQMGILLNTNMDLLGYYL